MEEVTKMFPKLFSPVRIGGLEIKNSVAMTSAMVLRERGFRTQQPQAATNKIYPQIPQMDTDLSVSSFLSA